MNKLTKKKNVSRNKKKIYKSKSIMKGGDDVKYNVEPKTEKSYFKKITGKISGIWKNHKKPPKSQKNTKIKENMIIPHTFANLPSNLSNEEKQKLIQQLKKKTLLEKIKQIVTEKKPTDT